MIQPILCLQDFDILLDAAIELDRAISTERSLPLSNKIAKCGKQIDYLSDSVNSHYWKRASIRKFFKESGKTKPAVDD